MAAEVKIIRGGSTFIYNSFAAAIAAGLVNEDNIQIVQGENDIISDFSNIDTVSNLKWNITGGTIYNCTDSASGGFIHSTRISTVDNATFLSCKALNGQGGAIFHEGLNNFTVNNSKFILNTATTHGGAITFNYGNIITVSNSVFERNYANSNGGAVKTNYGGTFSDVYFYGNTGNVSAGALYIANSNKHETIISGGTFLENKTTSYGGAIYIDTAVSDRVKISETTFSGNTTSNHGGAIYGTSPAGVEISSSEFVKNRAVNYDGGALRLSGTGVIHSVSDTTFTDNVAGRHGGAVYLTGSTLTLSNVEFSQNKSNSANVSSGAIYIDGNTSSVTISNSKFLTSQDSIYNASKAGNLIFSGTNYVNSSIAGNALTLAADSTIIFGNTAAETIAVILFSDNNKLVFDGSATLSFLGTPNFNAAKISITITSDLLNNCTDNFVIASGIAEINTTKSIMIDGYGSVKPGETFTIGNNDYTISSVAGTSNYNLVVNKETRFPVTYAQLDSSGKVIIGNEEITEGVFDSISEARSKVNSDGIIYVYNMSADSPVFRVDGIKTVINGGELSADMKNITSGNEYAAVDLTLENVKFTGSYALLSDNNKVSGDYNINIEDLEASTPFYLANGSIGGNFTCNISDSTANRIYFGYDNTAIAGNIDANINKSTVDIIALCTKVTGNLCQNASISVSETTVNEYIAGGGSGALAVITGDLTIMVTDSVVETIYASRGDQIEGDVYVVLNNATVGSLSKYENAEKSVDVNLTLTISGGTSAIGTMSDVDKLVIEKDAAISCADLTGVELVVDSNDADGIVAHNVTAFKDYTILNNNNHYLAIENGNLILKVKTDKAGVLEENSSGSVYGGGNGAENDGTDIIQTIASGLKQGTVFAGSEKGTDGKITTTVTGGTIAKHLYGGGKISAESTELTVEGGSVGQDVYGGLLVKNATKTISLGESNLTVSGGTFNQYVVGGCRITAADATTTHTAGTVNLTLAGGDFAFAGTNTDPGASIFGAGYVQGLNNTAAVNAQYQVTESYVTVATDITGAVYGGAFVSKFGFAQVDSVNITVSTGSVDRVFGGGWAQINGVSNVGDVNILIENSAIVDTIYAGGGNDRTGKTEVTGAVDITVTDTAAVKNIFMGGRYNNSLVSGNVTVTISGEAKNFDRIRGDGSFLGNTGTSSLVIDTTATVEILDGIDKLTITDGNTLNLTDVDFAGLTEICFDLVDAKLDAADWTVITGVGLDAFENAKFMLGDTEMTFANGVYTGSGFKVFEDKDGIKFATIA